MKRVFFFLIIQLGAHNNFICFIELLFQAIRGVAKWKKKKKKLSDLSMRWTVALRR